MCAYVYICVCVCVRARACAIFLGFYWLHILLETWMVDLCSSSETKGMPTVLSKGQSLSIIIIDLICTIYFPQNVPLNEGHTEVSDWVSGCQCGKHGACEATEATHPEDPTLPQGERYPGTLCSCSFLWALG